MKAVLDGDGLAEVWNKIKDRSFPIKHLTQNDYENLSEEEKKKDVIYLVDGSSEYTSTLDGNPIGTILSFMGRKAPEGYLICDGSSYETSSYPYLAKFFKEQFGSETYFGSDGESTFAVPDMRNMFLRGYRGEADDQLSGDIGVKQDATIHPNFWVSTAYNLGAPFPVDETRGNSDSKIATTNRVFTNVLNHNSTGNNYAYYTSRPVNMAVLYCIKAVK